MLQKAAAQISRFAAPYPDAESTTEELNKWITVLILYFAWVILQGHLRIKDKYTVIWWHPIKLSDSKMELTGQNRDSTTPLYNGKAHLFHITCMKKKLNLKPTIWHSIVSKQSNIPKWNIISYQKYFQTNIWFHTIWFETAISLSRTEKVFFRVTYNMEKCSVRERQVTIEIAENLMKRIYQKWLINMT